MNPRKPEIRDETALHDRRANAATPVFDAALSPPGTDAEAGGAPADGPDPIPRGRLPVDPGKGGGLGVRLTPRFWCAVSAVVLVGLAVLAVLSYS